MKNNFIQIYRSADVTIGAKLSLDANDGISSMKDFKNQIKEAKSDLIVMSEKFGITSEEARKAAKRVAELQDALGDAKQLSDAFNPDKKFAALGQSLQGVLGGFSALTGAMGLLGVESEDVQKQLLKVQSALALSQGLDQVRDSINSFKTFGKTIVETLGKSGAIGLAIAGVVALGLAIAGVFTRKQSADVKAYNDTLKDFQQAAAGAIVQVNKVRVAFEQAKEGVISKKKALKIYNDTLGESLGKTNDLNEAEKRLTKDADNYIKITALKAQANALFAIAAEKSAKVLIAQAQYDKYSGSNFGGIMDVALSNLNKAKEEAASIEKLGADLLKKAESASTKLQGGGFGSSIGSGGKEKTTPAAAAIKAKQAEVELEFSKSYENQLLMQQEFQDKIASNRSKFIENGMALEQADFDEKIALLNLELDAEERATLKKIKLAEEERNAKIAAAQAIAGALGALSDLLGRQTAAGKALAIAQIAIDTAVAISGAVRQATKNPLNLTGFAFIADMAARITAIIVNIGKAKQILSSANVPGASGGGGGSVGNVSAPLQPQIQSTNTLLNQNQLNQIGNATVRAFVVEADVSNNQERIRRLNRAARI